MGADTVPLSGPALREALARAHRALERHRAEIDHLNVFPVPDGDTGTNLVLTLRSALEAADEARDGDLPRALSRGALLGARGNSGVILSQVVRALAEAAADDTPPAQRLGRALRRACELAYQAVAEPVEGTMLTAIRAAAEAADRGDTSGAGLARIREAVARAVAATREQLEANRRAGVVDAGARGFEVFLDAIADHLEGRPEPTEPPPTTVAPRPATAPGPAGYEVQFLVEAPADRVEGLRRQLEPLGDSVAVVADEGIVHVHIHVPIEHIGSAIEVGTAHGRVHGIRVSDLDRARLAAVTVLPGEGLAAVARRCGAEVVAGAAGALPTVAELVSAARRTGARDVLLLPGHPNVLPTARQAAELLAAEGHRLHVIASATHPLRVLAALAVCDPEDVAGSVQAATDAAAACRAGEVVAAVRDADTPLGPVRQGQWLAVCDGTPRSVHDSPLDALLALADHCALSTAEVVTLSVGADVEPAEREAALRELRTRTNGELEVIDGRHRPARYLLAAE